MRYPVELHDRGDGHALRGIDADGRRVEFDDFVWPGSRVGQPVPGDPGNGFPPFGVVVARDGGLFIDHDEAADREHNDRFKRWVAENVPDRAAVPTAGGQTDGD